MASPTIRRFVKDLPPPVRRAVDSASPAHKKPAGPRPTHLIPHARPRRSRSECSRLGRSSRDDLSLQGLLQEREWLQHQRDAQALQKATAELASLREAYHVQKKVIEDLRQHVEALMSSRSHAPLSPASARASSSPLRSNPGALSERPLLERPVPSPIQLELEKIEQRKLHTSGSTGALPPRSLSRKRRRSRPPRTSGSLLRLPLSPDRSHPPVGPRLRKEERAKSTTFLRVPGLHASPQTPRGSSDQESAGESRGHSSFLRLLPTPGRKRQHPSPESTLRPKRLSRSLEEQGEGESARFGVIRVRVPGEQMLVHVPIHADMTVAQIKTLALAQLLQRCPAREKAALEARLLQCQFAEELPMAESERPFAHHLASRVGGQFVLHDADRQSWAVLPLPPEGAPGPSPPRDALHAGETGESGPESRLVSESEESEGPSRPSSFDSPPSSGPDSPLLLPARLGETFTRCRDPVVTLLSQRVDTLSQEVQHLRALLAKSTPRKRAFGGGGGRGRKITLDGERVEVHSKLAETGGSSARVYSVQVDGWNCALKELRYEEVSFDLDAHVGFLNEVHFLSTLPSHPNIIRYLFHEAAPDSMRLFLEYYDGTLGDFLRRRRDTLSRAYATEENVDGGGQNVVTAPAPPSKFLYSPRELQRLLVDIAEGLDFLHGHKIIHRDLKSDNIFVRLNRTHDIQRLVIGDFDTCKNMKNLDVTRTLIGTPSCIAPEVLNSATGNGYSFPVDVYSFGILLYELLTLSRPYDGLKLFEIACHIREGKRPLLPSYVDSERYRPFIDLYHDTTAFDPAQRPTASAVLERLKSLFIY